MTDNEVIKALKCCINNDALCSKCPYKEIECINSSGDNLMLKNVIDLINRQKAEKQAMIDHIKCLQYENDKLQARNNELNTLNKTASQEAIKEFWNRLSDNADTTQVDAFHSAYVIKDEDAENLIKEMTEQRGEGK